jgi:hypothetical protein
VEDGEVLQRNTKKNDGTGGKTVFFFPEKLIDFFLNKNLEKNRSLQFFLKPFSG